VKGLTVRGMSADQHTFLFADLAGFTALTAVNVAARVSGAAGGDEVLLTGATRAFAAAPEEYVGPEVA
jgi:class 3 adenylate cyclase